MIPISYTLAYNREDARETRETIQRLMERLVALTLSCGIPYQLAVDVQHWDLQKPKGITKLLKEPDPEMKRPSGMKRKHNTLIRWTASFDKSKLDKLTNRPRRAGKSPSRKKSGA